MKYGVVFIFIGVALAIYAFRYGWWGLPLWWLSLSFFFAGEAYLLNRPDFLGKGFGGIKEFLTKSLMLPYLIYVRGVWLLVRVFRQENAYAELDESLFIGRRLFAYELPEGIERVVDLTAEFAVHKQWLDKIELICLPTLDAMPFSDVEHAIQFYKTMATNPKPTYIHCAEGHGRTGTFTAGWLMFQGIHKTSQEALSAIQSVRPRVKLSSAQLMMLEGLEVKFMNPAESDSNKLID
ncbi:MAG: dual specificity protein phosphatase family protein [Planctomycetota bacterium]